jgi:hypothetical protein
MDLLIEQDRFGRLVCTLVDEDCTATVTASNAMEAGVVLAAALGEARDAGYGECLWSEQQGDYRWMFRRSGDGLAVVVLWSTGVVTGWAHVFRGDCAFAWFDQRLQAELARLAASRHTTS